MTAAAPACPHCGESHPEQELICPRTGTQLPLEGRVLDGKFKILSMLGEGGMATVWRAENLKIKRHVAIKIMHPEFARAGKSLERFQNEATAAGRIGSQQICDIFDFGESRIGPYIVMEMLRGRSLGSVLSRAVRLEPAVAVLIARQALLGLDAAHRVGIIHRDLKPENLFLHEPESGRMMVKLMDFGISKFSDEGTMGRTGANVLMGTPEYMSPEQAEGAAKVDVRTDVWAMGVILYRAISGVEPFLGPTLAATLYAVAMKTPPRLDASMAGVHPELASLVDRCLAKDPNQRIGSARELFDRLAPFETPSAEGLGYLGAAVGPGPMPGGVPAVAPSAAGQSWDGPGAAALSISPIGQGPVPGRTTDSYPGMASASGASLAAGPSIEAAASSAGSPWSPEMAQDLAPPGTPGAGGQGRGSIDSNAPQAWGSNQVPVTGGYPSLTSPHLATGPSPRPQPPNAVADGASPSQLRSPEERSPTFSSELPRHAGSDDSWSMGQRSTLPDRHGMLGEERPPSGERRNGSGGVIALVLVGVLVLAIGVTGALGLAGVIPIPFLAGRNPTAAAGSSDISENDGSDDGETTADGGTAARPRDLAGTDSAGNSGTGDGSSDGATGTGGTPVAETSAGGDDGKTSAGAADGGMETNGEDGGAADAGGDDGGNPKPDFKPPFDPAKLYREGNLYAPKGSSPMGTYSAAKSYCRKLDRQTYAGLSRWRMAKPDELKLFGAATKTKYWSSEASGANATTVNLLNNSERSEPQTGNARAFCVSPK